MADCSVLSWYLHILWTCKYSTRLLSPVESKLFLYGTKELSQKLITGENHSNIDIMILSFNGNLDDTFIVSLEYHSITIILSYHPTLQTIQCT